MYKVQIEKHRNQVKRLISPNLAIMPKTPVLPMLEDCTIFHFGTLSMTHDGVRTATEKAVQYARAHGALISFDPNLRPPALGQP